jgi:adenine-specific DNA-methyltransferase
MELVNQRIVNKTASTVPDFFLEYLSNRQTNFQVTLDKKRQSEMGQFFTSLPTARMMAGMFTEFPQEIDLVDPGAGIGVLSAAFVANAVKASPKPKKITVTAFELDPTLIKDLEVTLNSCQLFCSSHQIDFQYTIRQEDFIVSSVEILQGKNSLFAISQPTYNFAILNPPYKKINSDSRTRQLLNSIGIETTNLYSAFMWLVAKLLLPNGEMVAIVPRSFCNGTYFRPFRSDLLQTMAIRRIHLFDSRTKAFKEDSVLQENIIFYATKTNETQKKIIITSNDNPDDTDLVTREIDFNHLVQPGDPELYIHLVSDQLGHQINTKVNGLSSSLKELGLTVSTGRVVDFRSRDLLRDEPDKEIIPLLYPNNIKNGLVSWPLSNTRKSSYLASSSRSKSLTVPGQYYVLVKRFSSKEEKRRIYAAFFDPKKISANNVGIENHLNYFHRRYGGLSADLAKGLTLYLNSSLVDQFFRQFSGHTQVNATDLRNIKYPSETQLLALGRRILDKFPDQDEIDKIVTEELTLNDNAQEMNIKDPILAKKKIKEALNILQLLNIPRAQQNDRSALTLLSLLNIQSTTPWRDASENLIGITEMMDYFRDNFGVNYAPNTRETVRRQTIHQFMQMGLVVANPDDPERPINSPKTRYLIEASTLKLMRSFGSTEWDSTLHEYFNNANLLDRLQIKERNMLMIPVTLPNGENLLLSSGGQNNLIKQIIEEFCPHFTPGGKIIYVGDAGGKLTDIEVQCFEQLGIRIDRHGKMPDVVISLPEKKWLVLIEAVTSHGPIDLKRHNELNELFGGGVYGLVFVTAFESRKVMHKYLSEIAWETEVWTSEAPSHLIHFNGERFLGPYPG